MTQEVKRSKGTPLRVSTKLVGTVNRYWKSGSLRLPLRHPFPLLPNNLTFCVERRVNHRETPSIMSIFIFRM